MRSQEISIQFSTYRIYVDLNSLILPRINGQGTSQILISKIYKKHLFERENSVPVALTVGKLKRDVVD